MSKSRWLRAGLAVLLIMCIVGLASSQVHAAADSGELDEASKGAPVTFKAEVSKMLDILVNSLYTNRAIFLRELISNGSDALDKIRVLYLTKPQHPKNSAGEEPSMDIRISFDQEKQQLIIRDGGVGMTKDELANNLGSLGTSGTKGFLEQLQQTSGGNNAQIGQFGVGFYSVFLVAERVRVTSKSDESDHQWVWESTGDGKFFLYEDPAGNTLGRGTEIRIDVKPDATEFLDSDLIKKTIHQYSEFIDFPIYVWEKVTHKAAAPTPEEQAAQGEDDVLEEQPETDALQWTRVNENRPIWTRNPAEVTADEYHKFYKSLTNDYADPMYYSHFRVEGEVEFDSILFIPNRASPELFTDDAAANKNIKLYVRRVFITDEFRDLLPRYLNFVQGVVDSNDLPLNVSRELLQENRILRVIKKKLVRKALNMFADIAAQDARLTKGAAEGTEVPPSAVPGTTAFTAPRYNKFWEEFGRHIRMGLLQDTNNRGRLTKLLRYRSSKSGDDLTSLEDYVSRMKPKQRGIYYLSGDSVEQIRESPLLEDAVARDVEVVFMTDAVDEYLVAQIPDVAGKKLINLAKEGVQLEDTDEKQRVLERKRDEKYKPLFNTLRGLFGLNELRRVVLTKRHTTEAFIVSSGDNQMTARLAKLIKSQALGWDSAPVDVQRVLEINHRHPLVEELFKRFAVDDEDPVAMDIAWVLYDTANLRAEFPVKDMGAFAKRVNRLLRSSVDIAPDESLLPEDTGLGDDVEESTEDNGDL